MNAFEEVFEVPVEGEVLKVNRSQLVLLHAMVYVTEQKSVDRMASGFHVAQVRQYLEDIKEIESCDGFSQEDLGAVNERILGDILQIPSEDDIVLVKGGGRLILCHRKYLCSDKLPPIPSLMDINVEDVTIPDLSGVEKFVPSKDNLHTIALLAMSFKALRESKDEPVKLIDFAQSLKDQKDFARFLKGKSGRPLVMCVGKWITSLTSFNRPLVVYDKSLLSSITREGVVTLLSGEVSDNLQRISTRKSKENKKLSSLSLAERANKIKEEIEKHEEAIRNLKLDLANPR